MEQTGKLLMQELYVWLENQRAAGFYQIVLETLLLPIHIYLGSDALFLYFS